MALETIIPRNAPGIAGFASESMGNQEEPRFGDGPSPTTTCNVGASTVLPIYSVVSYAGGVLALASFASLAASGELTFSGVGTADDTITIGSTVYTLKAAPTTVANEVKIGATAAETAANLIAAINADPDGAGTLYGSLTVAHPQVSAAQGSTTAKVKVTALSAGDEANAIATTESGTATSWTAATLDDAEEDLDLAPYGILTAPVNTGVGETTTVDVYRGGHWNMDALNWHSSFDTDDKKKHAFERSRSPGILISKKKWGNDVYDNTPG
jgi:hypothetical protein